MKAYDLWFEHEGGLTQLPPLPATRPLPDHAPAGWIGTDGPGIDTRSWPRGPLTGLPMFHAITLLLPEEYQRRGPDLPAIAFFQGEGQFARPRERRGGVAGALDRLRDPFEADLARAVDHPRLLRRQDIIDGQFALLWLTRQEFDAGPSAPPPDTRRPGEHLPDDEGPNAWDELAPTRRVWLFDRVDPNVGKHPVDTFRYESEDADPTGWVWPHTADYKDCKPWVKVVASSHLGGTPMPVQLMPEGLTPYFLELEELPGLNFGGGNAQIDLESDVFDWACG